MRQEIFEILLIDVGRQLEGLLLDLQLSKVTVRLIAGHEVRVHLTRIHPTMY